MVAAQDAAGKGVADQCRLLLRPARTSLGSVSGSGAFSVKNMGAVGNNKQDLFVMIELMIQVFIEVCITYLSQHNQLPAVLAVCYPTRTRTSRGGKAFVFLRLSAIFRSRRPSVS